MERLDDEINEMNFSRDKVSKEVINNLIQITGSSRNWKISS